MRLLKIWILICLPWAASAQSANDWILTGHPYLKISVAEDALYRVTYNDLLNAGLPVGTMDPRLVQLFHRGQEQAILFHSEQVPANGQFEQGEYLEFYGRRNDGTRDTKLYPDPSAQPHTFYNLFSDTSVYFLTWNATTAQGKRMEIFDQVNSTNIPKETSMISGELKLMTVEYCEGPGSTTSVAQSYFDQSEGWTGATICSGSGCGPEFIDYTFTQVAQLVAGIAPHVELLVIGRDEGLHQMEVLAGPDAGSLRSIGAKTFNNFETSILSVDLNTSDIGVDGRIVFRIKAATTTAPRNRLSVSYINLKIPQSFDIANAAAKTFELQPNANGKSYIEMTNSVAGTRVFDITDPQNAMLIGTHSLGAALTAIVPNTTDSRKLHLTSSFKSISASQLKRVSFRDLNRPAKFIIVSHRSLQQPGGGYNDPVKAYAEYRASAEGGGYDTLTVMIDELYDQFNYGETSSLAVREYLKKMVAVGDPAYVFIIGKGRSVTSKYYRRVPLAGELPDLIPPGGSPSSDLIYSMGLRDQPFSPALAIGRLPSTTSAQVSAYLNKIKEHESPSAVNDWQKRVLHLSGGIQPNELTIFRQFMEGFESIAEKKYLGGEVRTLSKHSVSTIEFINISKEVNEGVNQVTFFGHSATNQTDIDIGYVTDPLLGYNNKGKYPMFLVNGCNAGDFYTGGINFGEDWILAANKGARNFIANSAFGYDGVLKLYTDTFYGTAFGDSTLINKGAGDAQVALGKKLLDNSVYPTLITAQVQQMILLGDPSVRVLNSTKPDYETSDVSLKVTAYDGKPIHALSDSLKVSIIVKNRGRANGQPLVLRVEHTKEGITTKRDSIYQSVLNVDTLVWTVSRGAGNFFGLNRLEIFVDPDNAIPELREDNNHASWSALISFNGTQNLQPPPFAIVNSQTVELVFQDTDLMAPQRSYELEIDTTSQFNSPFNQGYTINSQVLARKHVSILNKDSVVYYWRTRPSNDPNGQWQTSSFGYIRDEGPGFAQLDFDQIASNSITGLIQTAGTHYFEFEKTSSSFSVRTFGSGNSSAPVNGSFQVNSAEYYHSPQGFSCRNNTINLVAFDRASVVPYLGVPFTFQNSFGRSCGREPMIINSFTPAEVETGNNDDLFRYVDEVKEGDSVVLFSMGNAGFALWSAALKNKLGEFGIAVTDLNSFVAGEPVIIVGKKGGAPGSARIIRYSGSSPETQELQFSGSMSGRVPEGSIRSVTIGPSTKWKSVSTRFRGKEASDIASVSVVGIMGDGTQEQLAANVVSSFDMSSVSPHVYPNIRLDFMTSDDVKLTPAQLKNWIVRFEPPPDGIVVLRNPRSPITVQEGQPAQLGLSFVNISPKAFQDSVVVKSRVFNVSKASADNISQLISGPGVGDSTDFSVDISTKSKVGTNDISITVNSGGLPEQYFQNNTLELPAHLLVRKDEIDPLLDVAIDGRYVADGDLVSSNPIIDIRLRDENMLIGQLDTTSLEIFLTYPCTSGQCPARRINFSRNDITWTSDPSSADLKVVFNPLFTQEGLYELRVQGSDRSGNTSGPEPYVISFTVDTSEGVVYAPPYPNPSADGFFFEFQAAGSQPPEGMMLQIFSREGRFVSRFDELDGPPLHVGWNSVKWNGLDAFGDVLSPGLYFFQFSVIIGGQSHTTSGKLMIQY